MRPDEGGNGIENGLEPRVRAAQYVRMSTEHQQYSTANQEDVIREYALARGFEIVRTYADEGKSGLRVEGRQSLKRLIADVQSGTADFKAILVYDVSRWPWSRAYCTISPVPPRPAGGCPSQMAISSSH
jgi:hypothetical protein